MMACAAGGLGGLVMHLRAHISRAEAEHEPHPSTIASPTTCLPVLPSRPAAAIVCRHERAKVTRQNPAAAMELKITVVEPRRKAHPQCRGAGASMSLGCRCVHARRCRCTSGRDWSGLEWLQIPFPRRPLHASCGAGCYVGVALQKLIKSQDVEAGRRLRGLA